jgi:hypothetical protein
MRWNTVVLMALALLVGGCLLGCAPIEGTSIANPRASVHIDPLKGIVKMESSRDDKAEMSGFSAAIPASAPGPLAGTTVKCDSLKLDASASKVRKVNAGQLEAFADYKLAEGEAAANVIDSVGDAGADLLGAYGRAKRSENANTGYQVILAVFGIVVAIMLLLIVGGIAVYLVKKIYGVLFPAKTATGQSDLLVSLLSALSSKAAT